MIYTIKRMGYSKNKRIIYNEEPLVYIHNNTKVLRVQNIINKKKSKKTLKYINDSFFNTPVQIELSLVNPPEFTNMHFRTYKEAELQLMFYLIESNKIFFSEKRNKTINEYFNLYPEYLI